MPVCYEYKKYIRVEEVDLQLCTNCSRTGSHVKQLRLFTQVILLIATIDTGC